MSTGRTFVTFVTFVARVFVKTNLLVGRLSHICRLSFNDPVEEGFVHFLLRRLMKSLPEGPNLRFISAFHSHAVTNVTNVTNVTLVPAGTFAGPAVGERTKLRLTPTGEPVRPSGRNRRARFGIIDRMAAVPACKHGKLDFHRYGLCRRRAMSPRQPSHPAAIWLVKLSG